MNRRMGDRGRGRGGAQRGAWAAFSSLFLSPPQKKSVLDILPKTQVLSFFLSGLGLRVWPLLFFLPSIPSLPPSLPGGFFIPVQF